MKISWHPHLPVYKNTKQCRLKKNNIYTTSPRHYESSPDINYRGVFIWFKDINKNDINIFIFFKKK